MNRVDKTALVADWPAGLQNLLICQQEFDGDTNCGVCEKCIWAMTALVALGKLDAAPSFPEDDVSAELLRSVQEYAMIGNDEDILARYEALIPNLTQRRRHDLVSVILQFRPDWERRTAEAEAAIMEAARLIPSGADFIVADRAEWGKKVQPQGQGSYWGQPRDGETAIREVGYLREDGADYLVFTKNALWWPDHYTGLREYLWSNFRCLCEDERFLIFQLRDRPAE